MRIMILLVIVCTYASCNNKNKTTENINTVRTEPVLNEPFFPVTNYLKGQLTEIRNGGVNPLKFITTGTKTDSSWLKMEDLPIEAAPFFEQVIDTMNLSHLFRENKFLDQTINAYTFSYDPVGQLPDTFKLQRWDVYVNPTSGKVTRLYLVKKDSANKLQQLTWQAGQWCKIVTIGKPEEETPVVEKEVLIKWHF